MLLGNLGASLLGNLLKSKTQLEQLKAHLELVKTKLDWPVFLMLSFPLTNF